jgi:hypothetical protein
MVSGFGGLLGFYIPGYVERSYLASPDHTPSTHG